MKRNSVLICFPLPSPKFLRRTHLYRGLIMHEICGCFVGLQSQGNPELISDCDCAAMSKELEQISTTWQLATVRGDGSI